MTATPECVAGGMTARVTSDGSSAQIRMTTAQNAWLAEEELTRLIIGAFYRVYNKLGYGFLEHVYAVALERELLRLGLRVAREYSVRVYYDGEELCQQRLDFVVNERVVIEIKSTTELHRAALRQVRSYLKASSLEVGLLLHFGPEAKFYRLYAPNAEKTHPLNPHNPPNAK